MAIYHFGLFFLRKEDIAALVFGIFCFLVSIRLFFIGDVWITSIYPTLDWYWMYRFEYLSLYFLRPHLPYSLSMYFEVSSIKGFVFDASNLYFVICFSFIFKAQCFSLSLNFFQGIAVLNSLYILFVIILAIIRAKEGAIAALIGFVLFVFTIINDLLYNNEIILTGYGNLLPLGVFLFIFSQSFILSQIFSNAFKSIKTLSKNLSQTNEAYGRFVPVEFLKYLNKKSIVDIQLGDQMQKEMAILFSDIRSFTDLSEKLTPRENFNF